jgi:hypothetical protein
MITPNWNIFLTNAKGDPTGHFEWMCSLLFCREFDCPYGIHRYKNQPGIETDPVENDGKTIGWQAKFYEVSLASKKDAIMKTIEKTKDLYPTVDTLYFYTNKEWTKTQKGNDPKAKTEAESCATSLGIAIIWKPKGFFESDFVTIQNSDIARHFFTQYTLSFEEVQKRFLTQLYDRELQNKYIHEVHQEFTAQKHITAYLGGERLYHSIEYDFEDKGIPEYYDQYVTSTTEILNGNTLDEYPELRDAHRAILTTYDSRIVAIYLHTVEVYDLLKNNEIYSTSNRHVQQLLEEAKELEKIVEAFRNLHNGELLNQFIIQDESYDRSKPTPEQQKMLDCKSLVTNAYYTLSDKIYRYVDHLVYHLENLSKSLIYLKADAGKGKTHTSFNIVKERIDAGLPALFIKGKAVVTEEVITHQLKAILDVPADWSFEYYLRALHLLGELYGCRVPIIIDGIHESKYWNTIWKRDITQFQAVLQRYPNLVLILTYRSSYEEEIKDDDARAYKIARFDNFGNNAIHVYLEYFKIRLNSVSYASHALRHPLYLRLYCETKNPERKQWVSCDAVQEDIFDVFAEYIQSCNKSICHQLNKRIRTNRNYLSDVLERISEPLYESNSRGISPESLSIGEDELEALIGEDVLFFMEWNNQDREEEIQITYDLLAGYCIALYLMKAYCITPDDTIAFINSDDFNEKLLERNHILFEDILRSLMVLVLKYHQLYYWDFREHQTLTEYGREAIFDVSPTHLTDIDTVKRNISLQFHSSAPEASILLRLLENVRFTPEHPLNMLFLSELLEGMENQDRDIVWTERIRDKHGRYGQSPVLTFLIDFEEHCKKNDFENVARKDLYALYIFWMLPSTVHSIRNQATKALHWYFRTDTTKILPLLQQSFNVDDIYVRERVVGAVYAVAMNMYGLFQPIEWAKPVSEWLHQTLFSSIAPYPSSHLFLRDYASGIVELCQRVYPGFLSKDDYAETQKPFPSLIHLEWEESQEPEPKNYETHCPPMMMDFENYTLGRLVNDRGNYDYDNTEYKQVKANIFWRIEQLGYDIEIFGVIDRRIQSDDYRQNPQGREEEGKTDRYGKKYCWIAYYEQAGYREDLQKLESDYRMSDERFEFDIDISFPEIANVLPVEVITNIAQKPQDLENKSFEEWVNTPPTSESFDHIQVGRLLPDQPKDDWCLMYGAVSTLKNGDAVDTTDRHIRSWMGLVTPEQYESLQQHIAKHSDCSFGIYNVSDNYYVNLSEVGWKNEIKEEAVECSLRYNRGIKTEVTYRLEVSKEGTPLNPLEERKLSTRIGDLLDEAQDDHKSLDSLADLRAYDMSAISTKGTFYCLDKEEYTLLAEKLGYTVETVEMKHMSSTSDRFEIQYEIPFGHFRNESQNNMGNPGLLIVPAQPICDQFNLRVSNSSRSMTDQDQNFGTVVVDEGNHVGTGTQLAYIRKDMVDWYAKQKGLIPVWFQWCEKRYFKNGFISHGKYGKRFVTEHFRIVLDKPYLFEPKVIIREDDDEK